MFVLHSRKTLRCSSLWCVVCTGPSALKWERIPDDKFNSIIAFLGTKLASRLFSGASCKHIVHDCLPFGHEFAVSNPIAVGYVCPRIPAEHVSETMQLRALPALAEHAAQFCTLAMVVERQSLTDLLRNTLAGQHFLWTAGCSRASHALFFFGLRTPYIQATRLTPFACVHPAAPFGSSDYEGVPRFFDAFGTMKSSTVGGLTELRKTYVCLGYMYSIDLTKFEGGSSFAEFMTAATCTPLAVQIKAFGMGGYANKKVESVGEKGRCAEEDGVPIVGVPLSSTDTLRLRRIAGS